MSRLENPRNLRAHKASVSHLLRKDLAVLSPLGRLGVFGAFLLTAVQTVSSYEAYLWTGLALALVLTLYVPFVEWHQETDTMLNSLPVRRADVVLARYIGTLGAGLVALVAWVSAGWLLGRLLTPGRLEPALWAAPEGIMTFVTLFGLLAGLYLPLFFRLGLGRAILAFLAMTPLLVLAAYASAGVAWGPSVGEAAAGLPPEAASSFIRPSTLVSSRITALSTGVGPWLTLAAVLLGTGSILAFSERLSVRWFRRREF